MDDSAEEELDCSDYIEELATPADLAEWNRTGQWNEIASKLESNP